MFAVAKRLVDVNAQVFRVNIHRKHYRTQYRSLGNPKIHRLFVGGSFLDPALAGSSKSPDFGIGITSAISTTERQSPCQIIELLNKCLMIGSDTGRQYLRTLEVILSIPGAFFGCRPLLKAGGEKTEFSGSQERKYIKFPSSGI